MRCQGQSIDVQIRGSVWLVFRVSGSPADWRSEARQLEVTGRLLPDKPLRRKPSLAPEPRSRPTLLRGDPATPPESESADGFAVTG